MRSSTVRGVLVGVLVFALLGGIAVAGVTLWRNRDSLFGTSNASTTTAPTDGPTSAGPAPAMPSTDPALAHYYDQRLNWTGCGSNQCTKLTVPLDYSQPKGRTIQLAVVRVPASGSRVGNLLVNPGGPGGSGIQYAENNASWPATIRERFDRIGFDPRGVGESQPLVCMNTQQTDAFIAADPGPTTGAGIREMDKLITDFGNNCLQADGALARNMSTVEVAKDLDILRQALGDPKLTYFGASYGTFIGATYADLFPKHIGRMVLDGAVDPNLDNAQMTRGQAQGFSIAMTAYLTDCVKKGNCVLGNSVPAAERRLTQFLAQLEANPLKVGNRELTVGQAVYGIFLPLYVKEYWPYLTTGLTQAFKGNGTVLLTLADAYVARGSSGYKDNSFQALYAVNCLDHPDAIPSDQVPQHFAEFDKINPVFGKMFAFSLATCSDWPVKSNAKPHEIHAPGAPPIVVVGTTRDPATPLPWAEALAKQLDSGRLIVRDGDGHTGFNQGNSCVDKAVEAYLIKGTPPKKGLHC